MKENQKLLTIDDLAEVLSTKKSKIRAMIFKRELRPIKLGRLIRFHPDYVNEYLENLKQNTGQ